MDLEKENVNISSKDNADRFAEWLANSEPPITRHPKKVVAVVQAFSSLLLKKQVTDFRIFDNTNSAEILKLIDVVNEKKRILFYSAKNYTMFNRALILYYRFLTENKKLSHDESLTSDNSVLSKPQNKQEEKIGVRLDLVDMPSVSFTKPCHMSYKGKVFSNIKTWADVYKNLLTELMIEFPDIIVSGVRFGNSNKLDISLNKIELRKPKKLTNSLYYETNLSAADICKRIKNAIDLCKVDYSDVEILYVRSYGKEVTAKTVAESEPVELSCQKSDIEKAVLAAGINGVTYENLTDNIGGTEFSIRKVVSYMENIIEIDDKLIHKDAFVDFDDGADVMEQIIDKLMQKNNGYVSSGQLYEYVRAEMNMFLNDNDIADERAVYDFTRYLFEKIKYHDKQFKFSGNLHISRPENPITNIFDLICKFSKEHGGVFDYDELAEYIEQIEMNTVNLRNQMKLLKEPHFFYYEEGMLISAKIIGITDEWKSNIANMLNLLFNDVGDHIILRNIPQIWFDKLPPLPENCRWTPLLLQGILRFYSDELGARTIQAMEGQSIETLHTMLVKNDSPITNFADAVIAQFVDEEIKQRQFDAEDLRLELVRLGLIKGNELIYNMPKALKSDGRFAWDAMGKTVMIRIE